MLPLDGVQLAKKGPLHAEIALGEFKVGGSTK
jgi:hypothetical protein